MWERLAAAMCQGTEYAPAIAAASCSHNAILVNFSVSFVFLCVLRVPAF